MRNLNYKKEIENVKIFFREALQDAGKTKAVIGLSGGIDSAVSAALAVEALGSENVFAVMLPYKTSHSDSLKDAQEIADKLGIEYRVIEISPMVDSYFDRYENDADLLRRGNRMARERMCVLYDFSAKLDALVIGTGNKSELQIGYFTQYGDGGCAFEPIGHLFKTEVKEIARILGIPESVITKNPTADLWNGQTDESEIGMSYATLDKILYLLFDQKKTIEQVVIDGYDIELVKRVKNLYLKSEFKRKLPPVPEVVSI